MSGPLEVLWEDPHGLAVAKPAGILTQKSRADGVEPTLEDQVRAYLSPADPASIYLGTVHRLDRPVSGVILWAKSPRSARRWSEQFARRRVRKEYWAVVAANPPGLDASGCWEDWLLAPDASGRSRIVPEGTTRAVLASTSYEIGQARHLPRDLAWVRLRPETGRTHQLRAQLAGRGAVIVGDSTYGSPRPFPVGIALHARSITIEHPVRRTPMGVEAPLPPSWGGWLDA